MNKPVRIRNQAGVLRLDDLLPLLRKVAGAGRNLLEWVSSNGIGAA
jgi:hypothetical protein